MGGKFHKVIKGVFLSILVFVVLLLPEATCAEWVRVGLSNDATPHPIFADFDSVTRYENAAMIPLRVDFENGNRLYVYEIYRSDRKRALFAVAKYNSLNNVIEEPVTFETLTWYDISWDSFYMNVFRRLFP